MIQPIRDTLMNIYDTETHLILQLCPTDNNLFLLRNVQRGGHFSNSNIQLKLSILKDTWLF